MTERGYKIYKMISHSHTDTQVDRIIFCVFLEVDYKFYCQYLHSIYPAMDPPSTQDPAVPGISLLHA